MLFSRLFSVGILAVGVHTQATSETSSDTTSSSSSRSSSRSSTGSSSSQTDISVITGSEQRTPTGSYLSLSTTITVSTSSSAVSTEAVVSTSTGKTTTLTTTLGSTTIYAIGHSTTTSAINGTSNSTATSTSSSAKATNTTPCNNFVEFCDRSYGNITEVSAHNSPFVRKGSVAANQELDVTTQLNDGIRLLQAQIQWNGSIPHFCHTSCDILDAGPITDFLGKVYNWVSEHPFDVVTILLGNGNYSKIDAYIPFLEETGLQNYAYVPPKIPMAIDDWPTLASMILSGKRVVIFMDYNANQTAYPWVLDEFTNMWETPFDPTNRSFPCVPERPPNLQDADAKSHLYMTNHNLNYDINLLGISLLVPYQNLLNVTNNVTGYGSLGTNAEQCVQEWGFPPKFLNVDFYNVGQGSVFEVAAKWNNVTYDRECCGAEAASEARRLLSGGRSAVWVTLGVVGFMWLGL
ncbi:e2d279ae-29c1-4676-a7f5-a79b1e384a83 [Sclerotinia trifoliorum]|uniref:E2d279ae-29c1-4676-a7f5-a79b1e384a83 n=1 Tax=Sclerotinia trifoliorum TaxID=28548 RepID=A0A8H2ZQC4_9HELO|nr:e2d279ae-29c1-4676-a7f5-a79b1e384a83 [Sclerotinia trifoliorum]